MLVEAPDVPAELPDLTEREAMGWDYELLGLSPDDHPLRLWRARLRGAGRAERGRAGDPAGGQPRQGGRPGDRAPGAADGQGASVHHAGG